MDISDKAILGDPDCDSSSLSGLPLPTLHDFSSPQHHLLSVSSDAAGHAVVDRETSHHSEVESVPHQSSTHRFVSPWIQKMMN